MIKNIGIVGNHFGTVPLAAKFRLGTSSTTHVCTMTTPSRHAILNLYSSMLRTSRSFSSYNFRTYFVRRTKNTFRAMQVRLAHYFFFPKISHPNYDSIARAGSSKITIHVFRCCSGACGATEECNCKSIIRRLETCG